MNHQHDPDYRDDSDRLILRHVHALTRRVSTSLDRYPVGSPESSFARCGHRHIARLAHSDRRRTLLLAPPVDRSHRPIDQILSSFRHPYSRRTPCIVGRCFFEAVPLTRRATQRTRFGPKPGGEVSPEMGPVCDPLLRLPAVGLFSGGSSPQKRLPRRLP
jgi:hypothetical protein